MENMRREDVLAYMNRDWEAIAEAKASYWAKGSLSARSRLRIADRMRAWARRFHPGWPEEEERAADLATHQRVSAALRRVAASRRR